MGRGANKPYAIQEQSASQGGRSRNGERVPLELPEYREVGVELGRQVALAGCDGIAFRGGSRASRSDSSRIETSFKRGLNNHKFLFRGQIAEILTREGKSGFKGTGNIFWADLIVRWGGHSFFYNFKASGSKGPDNVGGGWVMPAYLLGAEMEKMSSPGQQTERAVAELVERQLSGQATPPPLPREYFLLLFDKNTQKMLPDRVLPFSGLHEDDIVVNRQNCLQVRWSTARTEALSRSADETADLISRKLLEFWKKRAESWELLSHHDRTPPGDAATEDPVE